MMGRWKGGSDIWSRIVEVVEQTREGSLRLERERVDGETELCCQFMFHMGETPRGPQSPVPP